MGQSAQVLELSLVYLHGTPPPGTGGGAPATARADPSIRVVFTADSAASAKINGSTAAPDAADPAERHSAGGDGGVWREPWFAVAAGSVVVCVALVAAATFAGRHYWRRRFSAGAVSTKAHARTK